MATKCVRIASAKVKWYQDMTPGELFRMRRRSLDAEKLIETSLCKLDCCDMSLEKKKILDHEKMCRYRPVPVYHALIVNAKLRDIVMENIKEHNETHNLKTVSPSTLKYAKEFNSLCIQESDLGHDFFL